MSLPRVPIVAYTLFGRSILARACDTWVVDSRMPRRISDSMGLSRHILRQSLVSVEANASQQALLLARVHKNVELLSELAGCIEMLNLHTLTEFNSNLTGKSMNKTIERVDHARLYEFLADIYDPLLHHTLHPTVLPIWGYANFIRLAPFPSHNELTARFAMALVAKVVRVRPEIAALRYYTDQAVFEFDLKNCLRGVTRPFVTGVIQGRFPGHT